MNYWTIILLASVIVLGLKAAGFLVPPTLVEKPTPARVSNLLTIALLAALTAVETFADGTQVRLDARVPAVIVAAGLFALRVPFVLVIIAAAGTAAVIRWLTGSA